MAIQSYSRCWLHLIWGTYRGERVLPREVRIALSEYFYQYAKSKRVYMPGNYVNADHVHCLVDLPAAYTVEQLVELLQTRSREWINRHRLISETFRWSKGFGAFSVSQSKVKETLAYILQQDAIHRGKSFPAEYREFIRAYRLKLRAA